MVLYFDLQVKKIFGQGKSYDWPRPKRCPKCDSGRLWGHGYVERYFEGFEETLWMKRYRCVECRAVHTLRPKTYWRRFRHRIALIVTSLKLKISGDRWVEGICRQGQQYWWRGLKKQRAREGKGLARPRRSGLERMLAEGILAGTHSLSFFRIQSMGLGFDFTAMG